ncbi:patatin-like phospholipase family protein [Halioxenophilus aromaticivorans]|uniref:Patatin-like phospholipase family protein n=1 Tax=Halioxenophilus aromaticivorans TaxID=1306992 RepID=A0AAV3TWF3_9ALTE
MTAALVLSGGGARAAYQAGVLAAVADIVPEQQQSLFPIVCGTSAGAINALALTSHPGSFTAASNNLSSLWRNLTIDQVIRTHWWDLVKGAGRVVGSFFNHGAGRERPLSLLDNSPLRKLLSDNIHFENLPEAIASGRLRAVSVTAMAYSNGESVSFFQANSEVEDWRKYHRVGVGAQLTLDHLMASSALPGIFPTVKIGREYYGDGAIRQLSPLSTALHLGADRIFVIGVSNNRNPAHWGRRTVVRNSPSIGQVLGHLLNSAFLDSLDSDLEHLETVNEILNNYDGTEAEAKPAFSRIETLVISPSQPLDKIAGRCVRYLPNPMRLFMRSTGSTAKAGGATMASYLLFTEQFCSRLIDLGYQDAMWDKDAILRFFEQRQESDVA